MRLRLRLRLKLMTSSDHNNDFNDLVTAPAQQKLEWVTPKISLMDAEDTNGAKPLFLNELFFPSAGLSSGPS